MNHRRPKGASWERKNVRRPRSASKRISLIINKCDHRRSKGASSGHKLSASRAAQASEALVYFKIDNIPNFKKESS